MVTYPNLSKNYMEMRRLIKHVTWFLVAPEIRMRNARIAQSKGKDTILECAITAFPHAVNYWEKDNKRVMSSSKYRIEAYDEGDKTLTLSLR